MDAEQTSQLARVARVAGRDDLADALLLYVSGGPVVTALRDLLEELRALRRDQQDGFERMSRDLHDLRKEPTAEVTIPPPSRPPDQPPEPRSFADDERGNGLTVKQAASKLTDALARLVDSLTDNLKWVALVLLICTAMVAGGPENVGELIGWARSYLTSEEVPPRQRPEPAESMLDVGVDP